MIGVPTSSFASKIDNTYKLHVNGGIKTTSLRVKSYLNWPDYVFSNDYKLSSLEELEMYIAEHHHLPNMPSANEVNNDGLNVAEIQTKQMEKIEELTLYILQLKKEVDELKVLRVNNISNNKN